MSLVKSIMVWIARHALALLLIVMILILARYAMPPLVDFVRAQTEAARGVPERQQSYVEALERFEAYAAERSRQADRAAAELGRSPDERLRARRAEIERLIPAQQEARLGRSQLALAAISGSGDRVFAHYRAGAEIALLERERRFIDALLAMRSAGADREGLEQQRRLLVDRMAASRARWQSAQVRADALQRRPLGNLRNNLCRTAPLGIGCDNYRALVAARREMEAAAAEHRQAGARIAWIDQALRSMAGAEAVLTDGRTAFEEARGEMRSELARLEGAVQRNWLLWVKRPVMEVLPTALAILALAILAPILIKILLYFAIAPIAARRPPIRLLPDEAGEVREIGRSGVSQQVRLAPGETLFVLPEAVQSTPHSARKWTQWLLDWSIPLSSLASGMTALIGLRAGAAETVLVSATRDPLAEIALIEVASGSAMVLRPRALKGMVLRPGERIRITRHWSIGRLVAWLTFQFRYLVFHGPCILIVEGTRGVRLEPAREGRGVNQASTIGFSARLDYSVSRSEAFGAYLLGRQELFNDSFAGQGRYLYEEMPMDSRRGGIWGRGLRGLGDAALKLFGL